MIRYGSSPIVGNGTLPADLDQRHPLVAAQVELDGLREPRQVVDDQGGLVLIGADVGDDAAIVAGDEFEAAAAEDLVLAADLDQPPQPVEQRRRRRELGLDVHGLVVVDRVEDDRLIEGRRVGPGEPGVAVARPLHRACARRCGRPGGCCRPCRSRRRSRAPGCRAA